MYILKKNILKNLDDWGSDWNQPNAHTHDRQCNTIDEPQKCGKMELNMTELKMDLNYDQYNIIMCNELLDIFSTKWKNQNTRTLVHVKNEGNNHDPTTNEKQNITIYLKKIWYFQLLKK